MANPTDPIDFQVPETFIGCHVSISYSFPMASQTRQGGVSVNYPINEGKIVAVHRGSIELEDAGNQHILIPMARIWNVVCKKPREPVLVS